MKRITASQARKNWFRILDEVVAGETIAIDRKGRRVLIRLEEADVDTAQDISNDYSDVLAVADADRADTWSWKWDAEAGAVAVTENADGGVNEEQ